MRNPKEIIQKMSYLMTRRQKAYSVVLIALSVFSALMECIGVGAIIPLISVFQNKETIHENPIVLKIPFLQDFSYSQIVVFFCLCVIVLYVFKNIFFIFLNWLQIKFSCFLQRILSTNLLKCYMKCGYSFFLNHDLSFVTRGVENDIGNFQNALILSFGLFSDLFTSAVICILLIITDWVMCLAVAGTAVISLILMFFVFRKSMKKSGTQFRLSTELSYKSLNHAVGAIKDVILLRRQKFFIDNYTRYKAEAQIASVKQTIGQNAPVRIIEALFVTVVIALIGFKALTVEDPASFIAKLAAFALGSFRILPAIGRISSNINGITNRLESIDTLYKSIQEANAYAKAHRECDFENSVSEEDKNFPAFSDKINLENITFRYNEKHPPVLKDLNLEIRKGQSIAFIGQSGAGKSTLIDVLLGLLVPENGRVCMDGKNITEIPHTWSNTVGYIPQSVFLTDATLKENIAFGIRSQDIDEEQVIRAIEKAQLKPFIDGLEKGINTAVGDRGVRLSGGQRQRIAIARALYRNPSIMVLDEATSALDNDTEKAIMDAINSLQGTVTLIIVAHRLTTVKNCDVIYEVAGGSIKEKDKKEIFG